MTVDLQPRELVSLEMIAAISGGFPEPGALIAWGVGCARERGAGSAWPIVLAGIEAVARRPYEDLDPVTLVTWAADLADAWQDVTPTSNGSNARIRQVETWQVRQ